MTSEMRAQQPLRGASLPPRDAPDSGTTEGQSVPRSRPVSFYDNFKDVSVTMPPCVSSAVSAGNLNQVRDDHGSSPMSRNNRVSSAVSAGNVAKIQTPKVIGAVSTGHIGKIFRLEKDKERDSQLGRAPSMANCLSTTVPVNLATSQIAGRHTPTRNSLRHSRMIVMNRTGNAPRKSQPPLLRHRLLARTLAGVQTIFGIAVTAFSLCLFLWAPNLPVMDVPYWSGIPLLLSGSFGSCLLCCFSKEYSATGRGFCSSSLKILGVFLSGLATLASIVACVSSSMHLARLAGLECTPARVLNITCACRPRGDFPEPPEPILRYIDLSCPDVESILAILLIFSATCNGIGAIVAGWYCYLNCTSDESRDNRSKYTQVRTNPNTPGTGLIIARPIYNPNLNGR